MKAAPCAYMRLGDDVLAIYADQGSCLAGLLHSGETTNLHSFTVEQVDEFVDAVRAVRAAASSWSVVEP